MRLSLVEDEPDQVPRLRAFRARYPHVVIGMIGAGCWQARLPEEHGETIVTRFALRELLDKLDKICPPAGNSA